VVPVRELTEQQLALGRALEQVTTWLRRTRSATDLSPTGVSTLDRLAAGGPARITDLAQREGVSQPGMTTLVHRLVERGWASRESDPADGRATLVRITDEGRRRITAHRARRAEEIAERMDALAPEDQALLHAALPALLHLTDTDRRP
jgi:DNA-binding MarR family transcriptional regulator